MTTIRDIEEPLMSGFLSVGIDRLFSQAMHLVYLKYETRMKLNIDNISKTYPNGVQALKNVSIEIGNGIFGLLGPNGAGKSTLMRTIAALQDADSGTIMLGDVDVEKDKQGLREMLGYLPQEFGVYPKVSAIDLLDHMAVMLSLIHI